MASTGRGQVDAEFTLFTAHASPGRVAGLLPPEMVPTGRILIYLAWLQERAPGSTDGLSWPFREFGMCIGARWVGESHSTAETILHAPLYVDDPLASIRGEQVISGSRRLAGIHVDEPASGADALQFTVRHDDRIVVSGSLRDQRPVPKRDFPFTGTHTPLQRRSSTIVGGQLTATGGLQRTRLDFFPSETTQCVAAVDLHPPALGGIDIGPLERVRGFTGRCRVVLHSPGPELDVNAKPWSLTA
jgi:hypothetical protein